MSVHGIRLEKHFIERVTSNDIMNDQEKDDLRKLQIELNRTRIKVALIQLLVSVMSVALSFTTLMVVLHK